MVLQRNLNRSGGTLLGILSPFSPKAQKARAAGDTIEPQQLRAELDEIFALAQSGSLDIDEDQDAKDRKIRDQLRSCIRAKRPLKSQFCRGEAYHAIRRALNVFGRKLLKAKRIDATYDPIAALNSKRLKPEGHQFIRTIIKERLLLHYALRVRRGAPVKAEMQTEVLALSDLFLRYAPDPKRRVAPEQKLSSAPSSEFIQFLEAAFRYRDPWHPIEPVSLAEFWARRREKMRPKRLKAPKPA